MKDQKRDKIEALHVAHAASLSALLRETGVAVGTTWWVFASQTIHGQWIFTYRHTMGLSPGGAWVRIPNRTLAFSEGGLCVRVGAAL